MKQVLPILIAILCVSAMLCRASAAEACKPNIVFLFADDQRPDTIDFIKGDESKKPFFLYVAFTAPHDPRNPPEQYRQMYYDKRPPLPGNFLPMHPFDNGHVSGVGRDESLAAWPRDPKVISDQLCEYYGLITHLDEQVGRVMEAIRESPHADNTVEDKRILSSPNPKPKTFDANQLTRVLDIWQPDWIIKKYYGAGDFIRHGN